MPRKTKEQNEIEKKKTTNKKESTKTPKKIVSKEKTVADKKASAIKGTSTKKSNNKAITTSKKASTKKTSSSKTAKKATKKEVVKKKVNTVEYYDLPNQYNQTVVKVLAQTPKTLFVYWEISNNDREKYRNQYGENFFETTKPVLIVHNDTLGYQFEVEINDFANSWYLHVADSKCDYRIELGRRPIVKTEKLNADYIYISMSNGIESPNDRILFDRNQNMVYFRNVKTGEQTVKDASTLSFIRNIGKIYNIYDFYKAIYQDEDIEDFYDLSNPSSGNPSSGSLSSKFK